MFKIFGDWFSGSLYSFSIKFNPPFSKEGEDGQNCGGGWDCILNLVVLYAIFTSLH